MIKVEHKKEQHMTCVQLEGDTNDLLFEFSELVCRLYAELIRELDGESPKKMLKKALKEGIKIYDEE